MEKYTATNGTAAIVCSHFVVYCTQVEVATTCYVYRPVLPMSQFTNCLNEGLQMGDGDRLYPLRRDTQEGLSVCEQVRGVYKN
jgi:hypothetical protein